MIVEEIDILNKLCSREKLRKLNIVLDVLGKEGILAGGFIRCMLSDEKLDGDIDIFTKSEEQQDIIKKRICALHGIKTIEDRIYNFNIVTHNDLNFQLVSFYNASAEEVIDSFDFNICQLALDKKYLYVPSERIFDDIKNKKLSPHKISFPLRTIKRYAKYVNYGYKMSNADLSKFLKLLSETTTDGNGFPEDYDDEPPF